jgi:hypothetical protein
MQLIEKQKHFSVSENPNTTLPPPLPQLLLLRPRP